MMDHAALAVSRLTGQFAGSARLTGFVAALVEPVETVEASLDELAGERWIASAEGAQLDGCGAIVGEPRMGRADSPYRDAIKFRVSINTSGGTPIDTIRALKYLTSPTDAQYIEAYPASVIVFTNGLFTESTIKASVQSILPAGVSDAPVLVSFASPVLRMGSVSAFSDFFVNGGSGGQYLGVNDAQLQVTNASGGATGGARLGGIVPPELDLGGFGLDLDGAWFVVFDPDAVVIAGRDKLAGVFQ